MLETLKRDRHDVVNERDLDGSRKIRRQESVGYVCTDRAHLEIIKEAEREAQGTQGLSKNRTIRENVSLCRV